MLFSKLFKEEVVIRHFNEETTERGHAFASYADEKQLLDVQPLSGKDLQALPEGERTQRRVKCYGLSPITAANQANAIRGDWLYYHGEWYECVSSAYWGHTPIRHYESQFVAIDADQFPTGAIAAPTFPVPDEPSEEGDSE